ASAPHSREGFSNERPTATARSPKNPTMSPGIVGKRTSIGGVNISNPDRVLYPEQNLTKEQLARFYEEIANWILPHVAGRPLSLVRCPRGRSGDCFFQKHFKEIAS